MILMISGRTDICAFYSNWFLKRLEAGFVDVRNPFCKTLVSRVYFKDVDAFFFCTKNPSFILPYIEKITKPILFHITITPYKKDIEPYVCYKDRIVESVKSLSKIIGKENVFVRYDPIFMNEVYTLDYHIKAFHKLSTILKGYIQGFIVSFLDDYKNVQKNYHVLRPKIWEQKDYQKLGEAFSKIARLNEQTVQTCAENEDLVNYGFIKNDCLSKKLACRLTGKSHFRKWKARHKKSCNCVEVVDIGAYNTCSHFCKYCYANFDEDKIIANKKDHDENSTMLIGRVSANDKIVVRYK